MRIEKKIVLRGARRSGKTAIIKRYIDNSFTEHYVPARYADGFTHQFLMPNQQYSFSLHLSETDQDELNIRQPEDAIIICIDVSVKPLTELLKEVDENLRSLPRCPVHIALTKTDLIPKPCHALFRQQIVEIEQKYPNYPVHEVSSKAGQNDVNLLFGDIIAAFNQNLQSMSQPIPQTTYFQSNKDLTLPKRRFFTCPTISGMTLGAGLGAPLSAAVAIGIYILASGAVMPLNLAIGISILCACAVAGLVLGAISGGLLAKGIEECHRRRKYSTYEML